MERGGAGLEWGYEISKIEKPRTSTTGECRKEPWDYCRISCTDRLRSSWPVLEQPFRYKICETIVEALRGNRKGQYSIRINDQYRICFLWENEQAEEVEIVDYHS